MPVLKKDRERLYAELRHHMAEGKAEEVYKETLTQLEGYKAFLELSGNRLGEAKDVELKIEYIVMYEALTQGLGWLKRTKRRFELVKEYT